LTDLPNRRLFLDLLERCFTTAGPQLPLRALAPRSGRLQVP
jgi:hypothetical protein